MAHEGRRGRRTREELDAVVLCPDETFGGSSRRVGVLLGQRDHAVGQAAQLGQQVSSQRAARTNLRVPVVNTLASHICSDL